MFSLSCGGNGCDMVKYPYVGFSVAVNGKIMLSGSDVNFGYSNSFSFGTCGLGGAISNPDPEPNPGGP